jgi:nucleoside-diphosphate-sugar epimerase
MKVLVTGAAGELGSVVCQELVQRGHEVLATDQRFVDGLPAALRLADLRLRFAVYPLLEGKDAVVHLGNHPSLNAGPSPQAVLADNVAINANVFRATAELGVARIVFASSLQVMVRLEDGRSTEAPYTLPYFPLDGQAPPNPGWNLYGLSKELGERMLQVLAERWPELCCTALRFPRLANESFLKRIKQRQAPSALKWGEGLTYLEYPDAATLVALVLERQRPGYHQYFPAQALRIDGYSAAATLAAFFPATPLRRPLPEIESLVDLDALEAEIGFRPSPPLTVELEQTSGSP